MARVDSELDEDTQRKKKIKKFPSQKSAACLNPDPADRRSNCIFIFIFKVFIIVWMYILIDKWK